MIKYFAHSLEDQEPSNWQLLEDHLKNVSGLAAKFAEPFGGDKWARIAGLWHDLGKFSNEFQAKLYKANGIECHLETKPGKVIHSQAGGHLATIKGWKKADRILSWLIMGHHAGLTDFESDEIGAKSLRPKMQYPEKSKEVLKNVPDWILDQELPQQTIPAGANPLFFIRMLFSCLVDADFLDTESFMNSEKANLRNHEYRSLESLDLALSRHMDQLCQSASELPVNKVRSKVLNQCRKAAEKSPTVFSLTVPTGGGKTLSSLSFALKHAVKFNRKRIIYVIPYTSIIEQTADVFRRIPGFENAVVEHHSNLAETNETRETTRNRLASENWDAPLIVTTSVQFFESLFACRTGRCRKLHNIVNSIVIFDEAQCLPPEFLRPVVWAIRELQRFYRVTPVLCTATQPVLDYTDEFDFKFKEGFESVSEIIENPGSLEMQLKRVDIQLFANSLDPVNLPNLAEALIGEDYSVLCIVNLKDDAQTLAQLLSSENTYHLSTNMCAEHRSHVLDEIKKDLADGTKKVIVISTSLIEAGVDIDFPIVYRSLAGLDSIAQAAGRCNREGKLNGLGKTVVFRPERQPRFISQPASISLEMLENSEPCNLLSSPNYSKYFKQRFWLLGQDALDKNQILNLLSGFKNCYFRTAADRFRLINDDWQEAVIVPYGESVNLIDRLLKEEWNQRKTLRRLGRYSVNIPKLLAAQMKKNELITETGYPGLYMLDMTLYHNVFGFTPLDKSIDSDPEKLIL